MPELRKFAPGEVIDYTGIMPDESGAGGPPEIVDVKSMVVVEDSDELISLWLPEGTTGQMSYGLVPGLRLPWRAGEWELRESVWRWCSALFLIVPGEWRATWVTWLPKGGRVTRRGTPGLRGGITTIDMLSDVAGGEFMGWYVNIQEPLVRTPTGFDMRDLQLDIVVDAERNSHWKDEDELDRSVELGVISAAVAERARLEGRRAVADVEAARWPFDRKWEKPQLAVRD